MANLLKLLPGSEFILFLSLFVFLSNTPRYIRKKKTHRQKHTYIHTLGHTFTYIYIDINIHIHIYTDTGIHKHIDTHADVQITDMCSHMLIHKHRYTLMHTHTHCTQRHIHI